MRHLIMTVGLAVALLGVSPALAARVVTLSVPGMTCPACPVTVRTSLERVPGVHVVSTNLDDKTVKVEITDSHVTNRQLTEATTNAGYPSTVVKVNTKD
jgi:mercuric ion binding protein